MKNRLLATTALAGLALFAATPAFATCSSVGNTVTCVTAGGTESNWQDKRGAAWTVNMDPSAAIHIVPNLPAFYLGDGSTVNMGANSSITSDGYMAIETQGSATFNIGTGALVAGDSEGIYGDGGASTAITINLDGTLSSYVGGSVLTFNLSNPGSVTDRIYAGSSNDEFHFIDSVGATFDTNQIGSKYLNFEMYFKDGNTITTLTNAFSADWTVTDGTLLTSIASNVDDAQIDSGAVFELGAATGNYTGDLTGTGEFRIANGSIVTISGDNSAFTGLMNININNNATFSSANAFGAADVDVNQSTITFGDDMTVANVFTIGAQDATFDTGVNDVEITSNIAGATGKLIKAGTGTLVLSGTNTYGDGTTVAAGTLRVNGTTGAITVNNTGILGGTGTTGAVTLASGGTLAPGNSIGTLNIIGNVNFNSGSTYDVEINDVGVGQSDKTIATGAITINNGATLRISNFGGANTYTNTPYTYTILQGASVTGTFGTLNNTLAFLDAAQNNTGTALQLIMSRNSTDFSDVAEDEGQKETADAVEDLGAGNDVYDAFTGLTTEEARDALDQLSGEHNAGVTTAIAEMAGAIRTAINAHMIGLMHGYQVGDQAALAPAKDPSIYTAALFEKTANWAEPQVWFEAIGGFGQSNERRTTPSQDRHSYGALAGFDKPFENGGWYGAFAGYENGEVETDSERASSDLDNYHLGVYATQPLDNGFNVSGGVGGTYHRIKTQRYVVFPGFSGAPEGDTNGYTLTGFAEISKPLEMNGLAVEPFANLSITRSHMNGYTEENGNGSELVIGSSTTTNPSTVLGARFGKAVTMNATNVNLNGSLGWQHTFGDVDNGTSMRFAAGTTTFDAFGPPHARDAALVGLGASVDVGNGMNAYAGYNGSLSPDSQDHGFKAGMKVKF